LLAILILAKAAAKATSGVPGRFQAAVELLVEMVDGQSKGIIHGDRSFIAPLALTVFCLDLPHERDGPVARRSGFRQSGHAIFGAGIPDHAYMRVVPTADLNGTLGMSSACSF
jgi:F-type H+-transporting ATPase subunit a